MKKLVNFGLAVFIMLFALQTSAQVIPWEIKLHSTEISILEQEVTAYANEGYVPLGITYDDIELYILYVQDPVLGMQAWSLEWYEDRTEVQNGITDNMEYGYIPTGITYTGDLFYVLYIQVESSAGAWQLVPSDSNSLQSVQNAIQPYIDQGYIPFGITALEDEYWTLLLNVPTSTASYWMIETYPVGNHGDNITENIEQGYYPWGLMYNSNAGLIDLLYVSFD